MLRRREAGQARAKIAVPREASQGVGGEKLSPLDYGQICGKRMLPE
jgi:hypothetical protein